MLSYSGRDVVNYHINTSGLSPVCSIIMILIIMIIITYIFILLLLTYWSVYIGCNLEAVALQIMLLHTNMGQSKKACVKPRFENC